MKIIRVPMARGPHNIIALNIGSAIKYTLKNQGKKYLVYGNSQKVFLPKLNFGVYPDVLAVCEKPLYWDDNQVLLINPILIVEVISKSTGSYDKSDKFSEYKTLESFKEYVLIEQNSCQVEVRFREEQNLWRDNTVTDPEGSIFLKSVGCSISLADIYENIEFPQPRKPKKR
jgi:Uma2 family endonuclease